MLIYLFHNISKVTSIYLFERRKKQNVSVFFRDQNGAIFLYKPISSDNNQKRLQTRILFNIHHYRSDTLGIFYLKVIRKRHLHFVLFPLPLPVSLLASFPENIYKMAWSGYDPNGYTCK